jgi:hypothetical protein
MLVIEGAQVIKCRSVLCTCYVAGREKNTCIYSTNVYIFTFLF